MNKFIVMGNMTKDPERLQNQQMEICRFSVAVKKRKAKEGEPEADFFNFTAFGKTAEVVLKHSAKGSRLLISGRVHQQSYKRSDGEIYRGYGFVADEIEFAGPKPESKQEKLRMEDAIFYMVPDDLPFS